MADIKNSSSESIELDELALTMFVILRKDLVKMQGWTAGSMIAQACHATTACLWHFKEHPNVLKYTQELDRMHKVTLETKNEASMAKIEDALREKGLLYYKWREQPEDLVTCLATIPYVRTEVRDCLKRCQLYK